MFTSINKFQHLSTIEPKRILLKFGLYPWVTLVIINAIFHVLYGSRWTVEVFQNTLTLMITPWSHVNASNILQNPDQNSPTLIFPFTPIWHNLELTFVHYRICLVVHVLTNSIAIVTGFILIQRWVQGHYHKVMGWTYVSMYTIGSATGIFLGMNDIVGTPAYLNFAMMGLVAISSSYLATYHAVQRNFEAHREWMRFSYMICISVSTILRVSFLFVLPVVVPPPHPPNDVEKVYMLLVAASWMIPSIVFYLHRYQGISYRFLLRLVMYTFTGSVPHKIVLTLFPKLRIVSPKYGFVQYFACLVWLNWNDFHDKKGDRISHPTRFHLQLNQRLQLLSVITPLCVVYYACQSFDTNGCHIVWANIVFAILYPYLIRLRTKLIANIVGACVVHRATTFWISSILRQSFDTNLFLNMLCLLPCGVVSQCLLDEGDILGEKSDNIRTIPILLKRSKNLFYLILCVATCVLGFGLESEYLTLMCIYALSTLTMCVLQDFFQRNEWCEIYVAWNEFVVLNYITYQMIS